MHTLDAAWMVDVASGAAPKAVQVLAACHAEMNASAYTLLHQAEHVMGGLLEDTEPAAMNVGAFEALSQKLGGLSHAPATQRPRLSDQLNLDLPDTLKRVLSDHPHPIWMNKMGGIQEMPLETLEEDGVHVRLLSLPSGRGVAEHTHQAEELTLVLKGGFNDGHADYRAGDVCHADPSLTHNPRAHADGPCICLSVEMGRLQFTHPVISLASRVLGWDRS
ncbi:ChrR-like anti-ECFsigma factor [Oceanicaulis sp. 350]|jgi:putative transcriptional regulator|nr:cupin domain-containing protein [Oceanicaulis sp.]VXC51648.1 ChrR-like anti-ECFsigma factor [Oceanicaulis sp. 350]